MRNHEKTRILIVDDQENTLQSYTQILESEGYEVITASSVYKAREILDSQYLNLVITDVRMPEEDGMSLVDFLSFFYPKVAVIIITGNPGMRTDIQAYLGGAVDFLLKPVDREDLLESVLRCISTDLEDDFDDEDSAEKILKTLKELGDV